MKICVINKDSENILKWNAIARNKEGFFSEEDRILFKKKNWSKIFLQAQAIFSWSTVKLEKASTFQNRIERGIYVCLGFVFREIKNKKLGW